MTSSPRWHARDLLEALDHRGGTRAEQERFDDEIWARLGAEGTLLVTDLSGFTRTTRSRGIVHFLAIFRRSEQVAGPIIERHGGRLLKHEADDLIVQFPGPRAAIEAAVELQRSFRALNRGLAADEQVGLSVGVEHGRFLSVVDDAFGDPVNVAYKLGEDVAASGEILVGARAWSVSGLQAPDLTGVVVDGPRLRPLGGVELEFYSLTLEPEPADAAPAQGPEGQGDER